VRSLGNYVGDLVIGSLFNERPIQGHYEATNSRRTISIYVSRKLLAASILSFSTKPAPSRRLANTTSSRPARSCSGPFDGGSDALGEAAGEGDREIGSAGRDWPADGEGGPPSHHKIIPPADIEERHARSGQSDNGGDHDWKDKSCFAFHASLGDFALRYWATIKIVSPALPLVSFRRRSCRPRGRPKCVRR